MSSARILDSRFAWTDEQRALELLDWETKPQDFDLLCDHIIGLLCSRSGWTKEKLFALMPEEQMRREIRAAAQKFEERHISLPMFVYMWLNTARLPQISRERKERGES